MNHASGYEEYVARSAGHAAFAGFFREKQISGACNHEVNFILSMWSLIVRASRRKKYR
jgi:hypothetical protein